MDKKYITTIGLEIHAELKTNTKMFCACKNDTEEKKPNVNICPVCTGHPGTLPVINKEAVRKVLLVGKALGGTLADFTEFDRKNYFYPDIPKGYQISQYKYPLVSGGSLNGVAITRVHLEEDTAKSSHDTGDFSLVDFNRSGVPLMELVTEPVIHSAKEASDFAKELQLLLQYLGAGDANLEKGEMRVEANISVSDTDKFGTKVEVKNLNSFKAVEKAIEYEVNRHISLLEKGEKVIQETRGWDENKEATFSQRLKENSHDYRYFPDPDLPKLKLSQIDEFSGESLKKELPELPWQRRERYVTEYALKPEEAEIYVGSPVWKRFFEEVLKFVSEDKSLVKLSSNYITSDLIGLSKDLLKTEGDTFLSLTAKVSPKSFSQLIKMVAKKDISSRGAKDILAFMYASGGDPEVIAKEKDLIQKSDEGTIKILVEKVLASNEKAIAEYKAGKASALQFLIGQGMKESKGSANPEILKKLFLEKLV